MDRFRSLALQTHRNEKGSSRNQFQPPTHAPWRRIPLDHDKEQVFPDASPCGRDVELFVLYRKPPLAPHVTIIEHRSPKSGRPPGASYVTGLEIRHRRSS